MPSLTAAKLFAGNALGAVWRFLKHASFWQIVTLALACLVVVQHFTIAGERRHSAKVEAQLKAANDQLQAISTKRNVQHDVTERTVEKVVRGDPVVRTVVRTITQAPNPPDCKTPGLPAARGAL